MRNYKINFDESVDEITLTDESGNNEVDYETAKTLLAKLTRIYEGNRETTVYLMYSSKMNLYKIGITSNPVNNRRNALRTRHDDMTIEVVYTFICCNRREAETKEKLLHRVFNHLNRTTYMDYAAERGLGEEWFNLSENDIQFIKSDNLFYNYRGILTFHPMAFMRYAHDQKNSSPQFYQMIVMLTELLTIPESIPTTIENHANGNGSQSN